MPKAKQPVSFFGHEFIAPGIRCRFRQTVYPVTVRRITGGPLRQAFATRHGNVFQAEIVQIVIRIKQPELFLAGTLLAFFFIHHADETHGIVSASTVRSTQFPK